MRVAQMTNAVNTLAYNYLLENTVCLKLLAICPMTTNLYHAVGLPLMRCTRPMLLLENIWHRWDLR
jgi:hypothetical protein